MASTRECLAICSEIVEHVERLRPKVFQSVTAASVENEVISTLGGLLCAKPVTDKVLLKVQETVSDTSATLEVHHQKMLDQLDDRSEIPAAAMKEQARVQEERDCASQYLELCRHASEQIQKKQSNVVEEVHARANALQFVVATLGDLLSAKNVTADAGSIQVAGQMSDEAFQKICHGLTSQFRDQEVRRQQSRATAQEDFAMQYGTGYKLGQKNSRL